MSHNIPSDSVGIVTPKRHFFDHPLTLSCGRQLESYTLVYETYGTLNEAKSNAILICHALSGNHHAAGYHSKDDLKPGWWDAYIGPGKCIDTNHFFVVCPNNIGGCHGSTGPTETNPATGKPWGPDFPLLRCRDWVDSQLQLMQFLEIDQWAAVIGGSLGGMQAMRWATEYPDKLNHCVLIATAMKLTAQNIAFNEIARQSILSDPNFHDGRYLEKGVVPKKGLGLARMVGHITYLSDLAMADKFGRDLRSGSFTRGEEHVVEFEVESYLRYQGERFSAEFDANTYLLMIKALDYFDLAREYDDDPITAFETTQCAFLVVSFNSDWRFSPGRSRDIVNALIAAKKKVSYVEVDSKYGHDAFLIPNRRYQDVFQAYMDRVKMEVLAQ